MDLACAPLIGRKVRIAQRHADGAVTQVSPLTEPHVPATCCAEYAALSVPLLQQINGAQTAPPSPQTCPSGLGLWLQRGRVRIWPIPSMEL